MYVVSLHFVFTLFGVSCRDNFFRHLAFCTELKKLFLSRSPFQTLRGALAFQKFPGRQILRKRLSSIHADLRCQGTWVQTRSWCHCSCRRHTCSWGLKPHLPARREWKSTERWWGMREECVHLFRKSCEQVSPRHSPRAGDARRVDSQSLDNTYKHRRHEFLSLSILTEISVNFRNLWYHWEGTSTTGKKPSFWSFDVSFALLIATLFDKEHVWQRDIWVWLKKQSS